MSSSVSGIPAGVPSTTTPSAGPCDSPQVVSRKIFPKLLPMLAGVSLHLCDLSADAWHLSRAEKSRAPFRTAPSAKKPVVVFRSALESKALVEPLRSHVCALCAQGDAPRASLSHGVDGQTERLESEPT